MDSQSRRRLIERVIRATAAHLGGGEPTKDDIAKILDQLSTKGRPRKTAYSAEQLRLLTRVQTLTRAGATKPNPAYHAVAAESPGHSESATYHWLRRHYPRYQAEQESLFVEVMGMVAEQLEAMAGGTPVEPVAGSPPRDK